MLFFFGFNLLFLFSVIMLVKGTFAEKWIKQPQVQGLVGTNTGLYIINDLSKKKKQFDLKLEIEQKDKAASSEDFVFETYKFRLEHSDKNSLEYKNLLTKIEE